MGGSSYQVPVEVRPERNRPGHPLMITFSHNRSPRVSAWPRSWTPNHARRGVKKREDTHKMAEANRAFAHYRW